MRLYVMIRRLWQSEEAFLLWLYSPNLEEKTLVSLNIKKESNINYINNIRNNVKEDYIKYNNSDCFWSKYGVFSYITSKYNITRNEAVNICKNLKDNS